MSTLSLRLPDSLHEEIKIPAKKEGISINQFITSAVAEKMSALLTESYLIERASKGSKKSFFKCNVKST
jgi:uncharacterized protein (DUF1778 family)